MNRIEKLEIPENALREILYNTKKLRSKGILRRVGGDKGGYWEIL